MDYKYIEQLLESYFAGETSLQEEQILHAFFSQEQVPQSLAQYQPLFACKDSILRDEQLGDDFDARLLALTQEREPAVRARTVGLRDRLMPLFRAAAVVAIILTLGNALRFSMEQMPQPSDDINYADYTDTYNDPAMAYDKVEDALLMLSEGYSQALADTTGTDMKLIEQ